MLVLKHGYDINQLEGLETTLGWVDDFLRDELNGLNGVPWNDMYQREAGKLSLMVGQFARVLHEMCTTDEGKQQLTELMNSLKLETGVVSSVDSATSLPSK